MYHLKDLLSVSDIIMPKTKRAKKDESSDSDSGPEDVCYFN